MLVRRVLSVVPLLLVLLPAAGPAGAQEPLAPDLVPAPEQAAADGVGPKARQETDTFDEGVIRRTASLRDVESESPNPQHQLTGVDVTVDLVAQTFTATASFAQAPTDADAVLGVVLGEWDGSSCIASFFGLGTTVSGEGEGRFADGGELKVTTVRQGASVTLTSVPDGRLRQRAFECAYASVLPTDPNGSLLSRAFAEPLDEVYRPALAVEPDARMVGAKKGRWADLRVTLRNTSQGDATGVRLVASGAGIKIRNAKRTVGAVEGGSSEYLTFKVQLKPTKAKKGKNKKGRKKGQQIPRPRTLTLTATAPGAPTARATTRVVMTPRPTVPKKLAGSYWWGWESTNTGSSAGWVNHAVWFVNKKWAYLGWADGHKPRCSAKVKECVRYSWNKRKGVVRIGKKRAKVTSEGFALVHPGAGEKLRFHPLTLAKKGMKVQTELLHQNWTGYCLITCTAWTEWLSLGKDGRFVRSRMSVGSWPGLGSVWSTTPPDQRGTYQVVRKGIVELRYADGTRKREVMALDHDPSGKPNAVAAGVLLGDTNYYP